MPIRVASKNSLPYWIVLLVQCLLLLVVASSGFAASYQDDTLTPLQAEIKKQQTRLDSTEIEERRDAISRLGLLHHPTASRVALAGLKDVAASVRVAAVNATLWLPADEASTVLVPLLKDKDEFIRQETAYALGKTHSRTAVAPLIDLLATEKGSGARAAAVVALGQLGDETAVVALAQLIAPEAQPGQKQKKRAREKNEFVLRAAARALGQIGSRAGVPALSALLQDDESSIDARREAAKALGIIGDPSAATALRSVLSSTDPYLASTAFDSLKRLGSAR